MRLASTDRRRRFQPAPTEVHRRVPPPLPRAAQPSPPPPPWRAQPSPSPSPRVDQPSSPPPRVAHTMLPPQRAAQPSPPPPLWMAQPSPSSSPRVDQPPLPPPRVANLMPPPPPSRAFNPDPVTLTTAEILLTGVLGAGTGGGFALDATAEAPDGAGGGAGGGLAVDAAALTSDHTSVAATASKSAGATTTTTMITKKLSRSATKRKAAGGKKGKEQPAKRIRSPTVPTSPLVPSRSTGIKMMVSPTLMSPSTTMAKSPSEAVKSPVKKRSNRKRKLTSEIWQDFDAVYDGQAISEAQCKHCQKVFKVNRDVGTSSCHRHLLNCEGKAALDQMLNQMNSTNISLPDTSVKDWKFDQEKSRRELVKLIVVHSLPFSLVEYPKFRTFVSSLNPWFKHVFRTTIKSDCIFTYEDGKAQLQNILNGLYSRVSLTADLWTSKQTLGYLCVTCHYINESWIMKKRIIKFTLVETPHDGWNLFNAMLKSLAEWNIEQKVFAITLDNASNNNPFVGFLKENLVAKNLLLSQGKLFHCRCAAHVLNLIVQEGLAEMSTTVSGIRESVKYVKSSQARKQRFEKMVKDVGITCKKRPPLDVVTRWNSTYHMLSCANEYKRAFEALTREDTQYTHQPLVKEWGMADKLCNILETFSDATEELSGYKYPTASLYFHQIWKIKLLLERESKNEDILVRTMVCEMQSKFQKYWDLSFLQICIPIVLDPKFKLGFLEFRLRQGFGDSTSRYFPQVEQTFRNLFDEYSLKWSHLIPDYAKPVEDEPNFGTNNQWADWGKHQNLNQRKRISELERYLGDETVHVDADFDILQYWKMSSSTYPILARMARDILAAPASTVASESAFSSGEKIISEYRSRLSSDTVETLICLQDWIRGSYSSSGSTYDDIVGILIGDEEDDEI